MKIGPGISVWEDEQRVILQTTSWKQVERMRRAIGSTLEFMDEHRELEMRRQPTKVERNDSSADHQRVNY